MFLFYMLCGYRTTTKATRIGESLTVTDLPALTAGEVAAIDRVGTQHHFRYFVSTHRTYECYSHDVPDSLSIFFFYPALVVVLILRRQGKHMDE
jgi:hypothetical protein